MGKKPKQTFLKEVYKIANRYMRKKMLNATNHHKNSRRNHQKIASYPRRIVTIKSTKVKRCVDVENRTSSCCTGNVTH